MASRLTSLNVGGDTERKFCKKNLLIDYEYWLLRISMLCLVEMFVFHVHKMKKFLLVRFLKLQPNPISAQLALIPGFMANGSHAVRMDPLFGYPAPKFVKWKSIF